MITSDSLDKFLSTIDLTIRTPLCDIMSKFGSDKGNDTHHNYTRLYNYIFSSYRETPINLFEVGLGTNNMNIPSNMGPSGKPGASLYGWREYFLNANVYGADVDRGILFNSEKIKTFFVDQLNTETIKALFDQTLKDIEFDIIIDDGLHTFEANSNFITNSIHKLKTGGVFIIEDLLNNTVDQLSTLFTNDFFKTNNIKTGRIFKIPHPTNHGDNNLAVLVK